MVDSFKDDGPPDMDCEADERFALGLIGGQDLALWDLASIFDNDQYETERHAGSSEISSSAPMFGPYGLMTLENKSKLLIQDLHDTHGALSVEDPSYDARFNLEVAKSVFSPQTMSGFAATFFQLSHSHVPVVHQPSFGSTETTNALLLAVVLAGSIGSPPRDDALSARSFLRIAEEYIFRQMAEIMSCGATSAETEELLETLQAAVIIHSVQIMRNDVSTRRRNRTRRLPALVFIVRQLGLARLRHSDDSNWVQFVQKEACIRIANRTAAIDWHQSGMFFTQPLMAISEMTGDMSCELDMWDAKDSAEYQAKVKDKRRPRRSGLSLRDFMKAIMQDELSGAKMNLLGAATMSDLNLASLAINSAAISAIMTTTISSSAPTILRAISRWQDLWRSVMNTLDPDSIKKSGTERICYEQSCVSRRLVEVSTSGCKTPPFLEKVGHDSLSELYDFITEYCKA